MYYEENIKYGLGYHMNSGIYGMKYNDSSALVCNASFTDYQYVELKGHMEKSNIVFN